MTSVLTISSDIAESATAVAVVVLDRGRVLFGRRADGADGFQWQLPGGWIDPGESPTEAARREVFEETGLELGPLRRVGGTDNGVYRGRRSISVVFEAECFDPGRLLAIEIDKNLGWEWRQWDEIFDNLFPPLRRFRETGYRPLGASGNGS